MHTFLLFGTACNRLSPFAVRRIPKLTSKLLNIVVYFVVVYGNLLLIMHATFISVINIFRFL